MYVHSAFGHSLDELIVNEVYVQQQSVYPVAVRNFLRRQLGEELIVIIIETQKDLLIKRVVARDTNDAAKLGQTLKERLDSFGVSEEQYRERVAARMIGFEALHKNEHRNSYSIDVDESVSAENVLRKTEQILGLYKLAPDVNCESV